MASGGYHLFSGKIWGTSELEGFAFQESPGTLNSATKKEKRILTCQSKHPRPAKQRCFGTVTTESRNVGKEELSCPNPQPPPPRGCSFCRGRGAYQHRRCHLHCDEAIKRKQGAGYRGAHRRRQFRGGGREAEHEVEQAEQQDYGLEEEQEGPQRRQQRQPRQAGCQLRLGEKSHTASENGVKFTAGRMLNCTEDGSRASGTTRTPEAKAWDAVINGLHRKKCWQ